MKKTIPIGKEDFKAVIEENSYYIDKTFMLKEIADYGTAVTLFTRPRRFGKTLNLSMIRRFFEDERTADGERIDNGHLFAGLAIEGCGEKYLSMQQQYPVIKLSLKSAKQPNFEMAYGALLGEIANEFSRHQYVLSQDVFTETERGQFHRILLQNAEAIEYANALLFLSRCLEKYHREKVIILIDEYDVPLENAYFRGFYDEMIDFIRSLFESALKTNDSLKFGVVTGCLRISRESIFTGLNNLKVNSVRSNSFGEYFGFRQEEVDRMLVYYNIENRREEVRWWYDGYQFGTREIYNPWSILNFVDEIVKQDTGIPRPYWANTSSNDIVRELVENADAATKAEMEQLISGETIEKPVHEEITYGDIHKSMDNLWNFLYFTGYLKGCGERLESSTDQIMMQLSIPNREIKTIYRNIILHWFDEKVKQTDRSALYTAIAQGDTDTAEAQLSDLLQQSISFYDYAENYYHGFLTGVLSGMDGYVAVSNRESGSGRPDLILKTVRIRKGTAIIFELKIADSVQSMETFCDKALQQIEEHHYDKALRDEGYENILKYGICFFKKECMVKKAD